MDQNHSPEVSTRRAALSSDTTDAEWAVIEPFLPPPHKGRGRPRTTPLRAVINAIFYLAQSGCQWRLLPKDFPPYTTVQHYFYPWRDSGLWRQINHVLLMLAREAAGREASPSAGVIDSLLAAVRYAFPWLRHVFADAGYAGDKLQAALKRLGKWTIEIVKRVQATPGFHLIKRRWVVERTIAWLNRNRRLAKDFEASIESALAWLMIASVKLVTRRLARP